VIIQLRDDEVILRAVKNGRWLVTGGAGYIGAHVVRALLAAGREAVVVDDLSTGLASRLPADVELRRMSVLDTAALTEVLEQTGPTGVIHLAAKKSPTESMQHPLLYARENAGGVVSLIEALRSTGGTRVVFSSSCSVYGTPAVELVDEDAPTVPESPYGESKLYGERVLTASAAAYGLGVVNLRYFNVVGAGAPELRDTGVYNLVPLVFEALRTGERPRVFGADYPTPDGTCVRDYVDVEDLADAHVRAAAALESERRVATYNVGRGEGSSVLEVLDAVRTVTGLQVSYDAVDRRPGDPARVVGRVDRIARELAWTAKRDLTDMVGSAWTAEQSRETA
jgi:UDP-glucose 4-epimerase